MPSLADVANDIKALLTDIKSSADATKNNTAAIVTNTAQTANNVMVLNATSQAGFSNIANGIAVEIMLQHQTNDLLHVNNQQNEVIICWLKNIAKVLCDIKHNTDASVKLVKEINLTLIHIDKITELVHAAQAMEVLKHKELQDKIEVCCPPKHPEPGPCFEACESPHYPPYKPVDIKWSPIKYDQHTK